MDSDQKRLFRTELFIAMIPINIINVIIYVFFIYPAIRIEQSKIEEVSSIAESINQIHIVFGLIITVLVSGLFSIVFISIYEWIMLRLAPEKAVEAKLKSKNVVYTSILNRYGFSWIGTRFVLCFETVNEDELKLDVSPVVYSCFFEGNAGILTYKEHVKRKFIEFYIDQV